MLPILARAATGSIARKMMGRKTNVRVGQAQPQSSNAIVKSEKFIGRSAKASSSLPRPPAAIQKVSDGASNDDPLKVIHTKTLAIEKILQGTLASEKADLKRKKNDFKNQNRQEQEENLEKKDVKPDRKMKMPKVPGTGGIFGFIKNFLGNIIMGFFLMKLVDNIGMLKGIFSAIVGIGDFIADFGIKLVDGLATFVDWGYKAYDATKGFIANFGVKPELFDQFSGALSGLIDALIIGSVILAARGEDGFGPGGLDKARKPAGRRGVTQGRGGQKPPRFRNPLRRSPVTQSGKPGMPGAPVTQGRGGQKPRTRIPGTGPKVTGLPKGAPNPKGFRLPRMRNLRGLKSAGLIGLLMVIPTLFEVGGLIAEGNWKTGLNVAISTIAGLAAASAAAGSVVGASLATGLTGIGVPVAVAGILSSLVLGGIAGWAAYEASYNLLKALGLRDDDPELKKQGYNEGGSVKKPTKKPIKRSIGGKKRTTAAARKFVRKPTPERLSDLPQPTEKGGNNNAWWDFLGWAGTGNQPLGPGGEQLAQKVTDVGNNLGENDFFGPILRVTSKIILDQDVNSKDIKNVGLGINLLINKGLSDNKISESIKGYAQGGMVSPLGDTLSLEKWVEKSFKPIAKKEYPTRYTSSENQRPGSTSGPGSAAGERDSATGMLTRLGSGGGSLKDMTDQDFSDLAFIVSHEALRGTDDEYGVAAAILNRVADPRYPNTIMGVGTAPGQFEAVFTGKAYRDEALAKKMQDNQGKIVEALKELDGRTDFKAFSSMGQFMGDSDIRFDPNGNFYHYAEQRGKTDPIPSNIPQDWKKLLGKSTGEEFTPSTTTPLVTSDDSPDNPDDAGAGGSLGGDGKFIQGNSGASAGVHFHVGPGHQTDGTLLQSQYFADARASAKKVVDHFLGKGSTIYDGRRGVYFKSSDEVAAAQRAHTAGGSAGGIDMQVDFETPHKFPLNVSSMAYRRNGFGVSANIEGSKSFVSHGRYDEKGNVAPQERMKLYHAGLRLGGKEQIAKILKGETVLDEDTTKALGPTLLARLDDASTPAGIQKVLQSVMGISEFPSYDSRAGQVIMIDDSDETPMEEQPAPVMIGALGGTSYDNSMDFLDYQG